MFSNTPQTRNGNCSDVVICGADRLSDFIQGNRSRNPVAYTKDDVQLSLTYYIYIYNLCLLPNPPIPVSGVRQGLLSFQINVSASGGIWFETSVSASG